MQTAEHHSSVNIFDKMAAVVASGHSLDHRSVLNILDSLRANQIPAKGVVTIVCRIEIRKMAEC